MMNIGSIISKAIKEGKWLNIKYQKTIEKLAIKLYNYSVINIDK